MRRTAGARRFAVRAASAVMAGAMIAGCGTNAVAKRTLFDYTGSYSGPSGNFAAPAGWELIYSWDCSQQHSQGHTRADGFGFVLYNADDDSTAAESNAKVKRIGPKGGDTIHYTRQGIYYITIESLCQYRLRVLNPNA